MTAILKHSMDLLMYLSRLMAYGYIYSARTCTLSEGNDFVSKFRYSTRTVLRCELKCFHLTV